MEIDAVIDGTKYPLRDLSFQSGCRETLDQTGALVLPEFLTAEAVTAIAAEGAAKREHAYFCNDEHNVYLAPPDPNFPADHPRNRLILSSKGCIPDDIIAANSPLRTLYNSEGFRGFLCRVLGETALFEYADPLSSINLHYADPGLELGWHFDNSSFAITLMIQEPDAGGAFEYVSGMRDVDKGEMNYSGVAEVLDGAVVPKTLNMKAGALVLFRGRNALHRVAPVEGPTTRLLVTLAYNTEPGISLSDSARMTFFGRLG
ncbi:MAG: arpA protein [Sneathiella sp.]|nr:MAG: arpA protein [Sneathiella sp.]